MSPHPGWHTSRLIFFCMSKIKSDKITSLTRINVASYCQSAVSQNPYSAFMAIELMVESVLHLKLQACINKISNESVMVEINNGKERTKIDSRSNFGLLQARTEALWRTNVMQVTFNPTSIPHSRQSISFG